VFGILGRLISRPKNKSQVRLNRKRNLISEMFDPVAAELVSISNQVIKITSSRLFRQDHFIKITGLFLYGESVALSKRLQPTA
jgi:hypothetical protein